MTWTGPVRTEAIDEEAKRRKLACSAFIERMARHALPELAFRGSGAVLGVSPAVPAEALIPRRSSHRRVSPGRAPSKSRSRSLPAQGRAAGADFLLYAFVFTHVNHDGARAPLTRPSAPPP